MTASRKMVALGLAVLLLSTAGCSRDIAGAAQRDPVEPGTAVTEDGYGIVIGFPEAPVRIEVFTEPQCPHCADLQADFGADFERYVDMGQLAVTYRPVTFFDQDGNDHSARVSNAMFLAAGPGTSAPDFQNFVEQLWAQQDSPEAPSNAALAKLATDSGIGDERAGEISAGSEAVDTAEMTALNTEFLWEIDPLDAGTPTVYDLVNDEKLDIYDDNWLAKLLSSV
ncbi:DsbA family protein [Mycolicibacterium arseniciresistens]|uniref:Thioredoxin domain-containing protein n=1 Tax=Mycolicibacterium arseniciresistens TaxID=3062257 RepID=A0ABT8UNN1_9MYCO|nr:thioredoxin domain-containing protein [Mycolicibacterium arseniciresistens]MDO3639409.1 thioredoxin domain-containing protein [Mycolicibacterium arseniciresistens]